MRTVTVYGPPRRVMTLDELIEYLSGPPPWLQVLAQAMIPEGAQLAAELEMASTPEPDPAQRAEQQMAQLFTPPPPVPTRRTRHERREQVRQARDMIRSDQQPVPGPWEMAWLVADELDLPVGTVQRDLQALNGQDQAAQARRERHKAERACAAVSARRRREQRQAAALRRYLRGQRRAASLPPGRPVAQSDKRVRQRTGRDDHLELGVFVREAPQPVPVFPVKVTRREPIQPA